MTADDSVETIGHLAELHAHQLLTALVAAGTAGVLSVGIIPTDDPDSTAIPHRVWPFVSLSLHVTAMRIYCMPTSAGTVLLVEDPNGITRCVPTWGAPMTALGAATLAVAHQMTRP